MEIDAIRILDSHRIMAVSTLRPDGWPQTTIVGYANIGFLVYFMIFRSSQKFANLQKDDRISFAIGEEPRTVGQLEALYASARATELTDPGERESAWRVLVERHPNLAGFDLPDMAEAVIMQARCEHVALLDYRQGPGHTEALVIGEHGGTVAHEAGAGGWRTGPG